MTLPGPPGPGLIDHSAGPVLVRGHLDGGEAEDLVLFASSAIGFVAVDAGRGVVRWQRTGEDAPELPVVGPDGHIWLAGRCARQVGEEAVAEPVLGCVEVVDRAGALVRRVWLRLDGIFEEEAGAVRGRRGRVLGRLGARLLWAHGPDVLAFDVAGGLGAHMYRAAAGVEAGVCGWAGAGIESGSGSGSASESGSGSASESGSGSASESGSESASESASASDLVIATCDSLMAFDTAESNPVQPPTWVLPAPRAAGVAGPVRAGRMLAWVRDHELRAGLLPSPRAGAAPAIAWTAEGHHAYAPGSLIALGAGRLLAVRTAGGIRPVSLDAATGRMLQEGQPAPGIQVLAAVPVAGGLAAAVRLDASLRQDAIIAWDADLRIVWAWPLPPPPRPRTEPVGLAAAGRSVIVHYDGRHAARLQSP